MLLAGLGDSYYIPATFGAFACCVFWWLATGLDGWADKGGGVGNSVKALGDPATAAAGAFGGVLSAPYVWVCISVFATLIVGSLLGLASARLSAAITPKPRAARRRRSTGRPPVRLPDRADARGTCSPARRSP